MRRAPLLLALAIGGLGLAAGGPAREAAPEAMRDALPPPRGPDLAVASNFGHGWSEETFQEALALGVSDFRDIIYWDGVERAPGEYRFDAPAAAYPKRIAAEGGRMSLTVNWGNPLHDGGDTPHTPEGRAALARFVVAALDAHPAIAAVEVGNEFNGRNFVRGPILDAPREERAAHHFRLLRDVHEAVKAHHPEVTVIGGAAHSVPLGYLWPLLKLGAAGRMDALALHPYSTPPEQLARQIAVLRRRAPAAALPIQVTEFGVTNPRTAPGYLLRMVCAMALSGVERAAWYPLSERGDDRVPLIDPLSGGPTGAGRAFVLAQEHLAGRMAEDASPDPFTYACRFDERTLLIWGEPRRLRVEAEGARAFDAVGLALDPTALRLSMEEPILLTAEAPLVLGENLRLEPHRLVADSYHQFAYPRAGEGFAPADPFQRFARRGGREIALRTMPGQEAPGTLWTPYLGTRFLRPLRVSAEALVPGGGGPDPVEVVHRYVADRDRALEVEARWSPSLESRDGIEVSIRLNGEALHEAAVREPHSAALPRVEMRAGDRLDFVVGPGGDAKGDVTDHRIVLREAP